MEKLNVKQIIELLSREYGRSEWRPNYDPLGTLVQTILSQNTSDRNSHRAFASLNASFPTWEALLEADTREIAAAIRSGGLAEIKAARIRQTLNEVRQKRGQLELDFLNELPVPEAREWLKQLPGVGTKTANCVLVFAQGRPALPVDTHIFRVSKRVGLVDSKASIEEAHRILEEIVPPEDAYQFHVLTIEHGRRTCKARRPRCTECVLGKLCPLS
ncbi:MAG: endonuclease III [Dehalococcoidales bacterium]|nr:endonuclease III [Dehalococcoidales bacterium]